MAKKILLVGILIILVLANLPPFFPQNKAAAAEEKMKEISTTYRIPNAITSSSGVDYYGDEWSEDLGEVDISQLNIPSHAKITSVQVYDSNNNYVKHLNDHNGTKYRIGRIGSTQSVTVYADIESEPDYFEWWRTSDHRVWAYELDGIWHFRRYAQNTAYPIPNGTYRNVRAGAGTPLSGFASTGNIPSGYSPSHQNYYSAFSDETSGQAHIAWGSRQNIYIGNAKFYNLGEQLDNLSFDKLQNVAVNSISYRVPEYNGLSYGNILNHMSIGTSDDMIRNKYVLIWYKARFGDEGIVINGANNLIIRRYYNAWNIRLTSKLYKYDKYKIRVYYTEDPNAKATLDIQADINSCPIIGDVIQIKAKITKKDGTFWNFLTTEPHAKLVYSSSNSSVATVSNTGLIRITGIGNVVITATYTEGDGTPPIRETIPITVKDDCSEVTPPPLPPQTTDGVCPKPSQVPLRYEHELDLLVTRIDARTVDINTQTDTDVYVSRESFSNSRNSAKQEFMQYKEQVLALKTNCESLIVTWESEKATAEAAKASCLETVAAAAEAAATAEEGAASPELPDCSPYEQVIAEVTEKISTAQEMLSVYQEFISKADVELAYINSNESRYYAVSSIVQLYQSGSVVATLSVTLTEGQSMRLTFPKWIVRTQGSAIYAQINTTGHQEFAYTNLKSRTRQSRGYNTTLGSILYPNTSSNNWKDVIQYVATYEAGICPREEDTHQTQTVQGIVRTVNDNGLKRNIYEQVTVSFSKVPRTKMRAGYGFDYQIQSVYRNNDTEPNPSNATGTKSVDSAFPSKVDYQPYTRGGMKTNATIYGTYQTVDKGYLVPMQTNNPSIPRNETKVWVLPPVAVEEYSGNVFTVNNSDHLIHPKRNAHEKLITKDNKGNTLNRWYTNFTDPDGAYRFAVQTFDAGVNHLSTCHTGSVLIDGVPIGEENGNDDFIKRTVLPNNPFPDSDNNGIGWNWKNFAKLITDLTNWYENSTVKEPSQIPTESYTRSFYLTPSLLEEINAYTKQHKKIILGEFVTDKIQIPFKK